MPRIAVLTVALAGCCLAAAPAQAVVGGTAIKPSKVPWFATVGFGCGGALVAPDRIVTAAHCIGGQTPRDLRRIGVGGTTRRAVHFSYAPGWEALNGDNRLEDAAIIQLDRPVRGVALAKPASGGRLPKRLQILGRGATSAPGHQAAGRIGTATLKSLSDSACASKWKGKKGNGGERFSAALMVCAIDADGRAPLSSGCNGDSGGPLYGGSNAKPVLYGLISWGGDGCGADHLPTVSTEVAHYRAFIAAPAPTWAPVSSGDATISGDAHVGGTLTCTPPQFDTPATTLTLTWVRTSGKQAVLGTGPTYVPTVENAGQYVRCVVAAGNAGGPAGIQYSPASSVKIAK